MTPPWQLGGALQHLSRVGKRMRMNIMKDEQNSVLLARFHWAQRLAGGLAGLLAGLALLGWVLNLAALKSLSPGHLPMAPLTAMGLLLAGAGLSCWRAAGAGWRRWLLRGVGGLLVAGGVLVLVLHLRPASPPTLAEGLSGGLWGWGQARLSDNTAWCFVLLGAACWLLDTGRWWTRVGQWLALGAAVISFAVLTDYLLDQAAQAGQYGMALNTALAVLLLSLGLLCARAGEGVMSLMVSAGPGGTLMRVLLPLLVVTQVALQWLTEAGGRWGWYAGHWRAPLFEVASLALTVALVWLAARWLERLHRARLASEARFAQAFNLAPLALTVTRAADDKLVEVNYTFLRKTGYTHDETLGRTPLELGLWSEPQQLTQARAQLLAGQPYVDEEVRFRMKDGAELDCLMSANLIEFGGEPCVLSVISDLTERRLAERTLERYRLLAEHARDIMLFLRPDGQILEANRAAVDAYGYPHETLLTLNVRDLRSPAQRPAAEAQLQQALATGILFETQHQRRDGTLFPVEVSSRAVGTGAEQVVLSIARDSSERQQVAAQLRESESQLQFALKAGGLGTWRVSLPDWTLTCSERCRETFGLAPDAEFTYPALLALLHPDERARQQRALEHALATGDDYAAEYRITTPAGEPRWVEARGQVGRSAQGEPLFLSGTTQDITARKAAERERHKFVSLVENSREFIATCDLNLTPTFANQAAYRLLGLEEQALGRQIPFKEFFFPADWDFIAQEFIPQVLREGRAETEIRLRNVRTGAPVWMLYNLFKIEDAQGETIGLASVSRDISARKQAEEALRESEARFRTMADGLPLLIWVHDAEGQQQFVNHTFCEFFGLTMAEAQGGHWQMLLHDEDAEAYTAEFFACVKARRPFHAEVRVRRPDGQWCWVESWGRPRHAATGEFLGFVGATADISARKRAEEQLRYQLQLTRNITDTAAVAIFVNDAAGLLSFSNPEAEEMLGYTLAELQGQRLHELIHYQHRDGRPFPHAECPLGDVYETGQGQRDYETVYYRKDGAPVWVVCSNMPIFENGQVVGEVITVQDNSERKRRELNLALLASLQQEFAQLDSDAEIARVVCERIAAHLNLSRCLLVEIDETGELAEVFHEYSVSGLPGLTGAYRIADYHPEEERRLMAAGQPFLIQDTRCQPNGAAARFSALQVGALLNASYISNGRWKFVLSAMQTQPREWQADEVELLQELAARIYLRLERVRASAALRASEERYRNLINAIDQGFCVLEMLYDAAGQPVDYRFLEVNPTFERHTGLRDAVGKTALELVPNLEAHWVKIYGQVAATGETLHFEQGSLALGRLFEVEAARVGGAHSRKVALLFRDVTESRLAEERLRESEARFRNMADHAPVMIWVTEQDGACSYLSQSWYEFTGQTLEAGWGTGWLKAVHPDDEPDVRQAFARANASHAAFHHEYRLRRRDGVYAWMIDSARPRLSGSGEFLGYIGSVIDISERKRAEEQLRASQRDLQQMADAMPQVVWIAGAEGTVNYYNRRVQEFAGITQNADGSWNWQPILHPEDAAATIAAWQDAVRTGQPYVQEHRIQMKDGGFRWHLSRGIPAHSPDGTVGKWYGTATDIDEIKQAEEKIKLANNRFKVAEEAARGFNYDWDVTSGRLTRSESIQHVLGYKREEIPRTWQAWNELIHPDDRRFHTEAEALAYLSELAEDSFSAEYRVRHKDGQIVWVMERGLIIRAAQGQPQRVIGQTVDISEHKQIEQEREELLQREQFARQQAEAATRAKDEFVAVVSHELRNPLNTILGYNRLLRQPEPLDAALQRKYADMIEQSARRQLTLIEDLLDTARIISGKLRLEMQSCDFTQLVNKTIDGARPTAEAKQIRLVAELDDLPEPLSCDPERLQQIVWNLLSNALKFTPAEGVVIVQLTRQGNQAELRVTDTGQGIEPEILPYIFDRFRQADSSSKRRYGGLGLGLALVKQLAELHGGTVSAASAGTGMGATFTLRLPLRRPERAAEAGTSVPESPGPEPPVSGLSASLLPSPTLLAGLRVMLVDDEAGTRDLVSQMLEINGAHVTPLPSAGAALALLTNAAHEAPDVLVCDIGMPGVDGYELLRQVRAHGLRIPAVALTAFGRAEDRLRAHSAGFQMHVPKPVEPDELIMVLASLTGRLNAYWAS
jgi:PAS domain S-box-containing protein